MNKYIFIFISLLLIFFLAVWIVAGSLFAPANSKISSAPKDYQTETVVIDGVHGWYIPASAHKACMLLMHAVRSNRRGMLSRAVFLRNQGYSSLLIDLQAHGETQGEAITYGYRESTSARSAVKYLYAQKNCRKVVVIGYSMGGAASLLSDKPINVDGYILEAVYPTIEDVLKNRLNIYLGSLGQLLTPLFYMQIPLRLDVSLQSLRPLDAIKNVQAPVLIINGTEDKRTTATEARSLYDNAPNPKEFYLMEGAAHTNLYEFDRENYQKIVLSFLSKYID